MSVLMLLSLLLVALGVVLALVQLRSNSRWRLLIVAAVVGLPLMAMFLSVVRYQRARVTRGPRVPVAQDSTTSTNFAERDGGSAWWPEAVETLHAQCYPTSREAARALARNIARRLPDSADSDENLVHVRIDGHAMPDKNRDSILATVAQTLRQHLAHAEVTVAEGGETAENGEVKIAIAMQIGKRPSASASGHDADKHQGIIAGRGKRHRRQVDFVVLNRPQPPDWDRQLDGRLEADIHGPRGQIQESVRFLDKPWVEPFDVFISKHPGRHYALARSWSLATYPQEARQQALAAASSQLAARVHARATRMDRGHAPSLEAIQNSLRMAINDNQYIVDEFSQSLETNRGGSVWRHAILVEFTPTEVANAATVAVHQVRRLRTRQVSSFAAFFGLIVLTCVVYGFLNVATKGYYREALLCGTVAIVLFGGAVLLLVA